MPGHGGQVSDVLMPTGPAPGARVGAFQLVAPVGTRRPSRTWRAVERATGTPCIVKLGKETAQEAALLRRFDDSAVPRLVADESAADPPHIAIELVEGTALEDVLGRRLLPAQLAPLLADLAATLGRLHAAGFVHGDVQPANVIVRPDARPVLIDFGSARAAHDDGADASTVELTPGYAAPECGGGGRIGPAADLYGLGAIGYRALTGRAPRPGAPPLIEVVDAAPLALRAALDWAMEEAPDARPESAAELEAALLGAVSPGPQTIRVRRRAERRADVSAATGETPARPHARRRRRIAAVLVAAALLAPAVWFGTDAWLEHTRVEWLVDQKGAGHTDSIGDALRRARSGAIIRVSPGSYPERLEARKDVTLLAAGGDDARPIIVAGTGSCLVVRGAAAYVGGFVLRSDADEGCVDVASGELTLESSEITARRGAAVSVRDGAKLEMTGSVVTTSGASAIVVSAGASAVIAGTNVREARGSGIVARGGAKIRLRDVAIDGAAQSGLLVDEGAAATLERVKIAGAGYSGIELRGGARLAVADGSVERAGGAGFFIAEGAHATLQGMRVAGSRLSGVFAAPGTDVQIVGAEIDDNGEHGLVVMNLASVTLRDTKLARNAGHGIALQPQARFEATGQVLERNKEPQLLDERRSEPAPR
jgi:hypothetical protein